MEGGRQRHRAGLTGGLTAPTARLRRGAVALLAAVLVVAGCAGSDEPAGPGVVEDDPGPLHVHGLGRNPADNHVYIATHTGLWRLDDGGRPERVGDVFNDFMGFTVAGPDHFLASGHPDLRTGQPPLLGLIESRDAGRTWESLSLLGAADFHALHAAHDRVYAWNSSDATFMVSQDTSRWDRRANLPLLDFAVHPGDPEAIVATTAGTLETTQLSRSADGGRTWQPVEAPGLDRLSWHAAGRLFGIALDGVVWRSRDGGASWREAGAVPGRAGALLDTGDALYAAVGDAVLRSTDDGATWAALYEPA